MENKSVDESFNQLLAEVNSLEEARDIDKIIAYQLILLNRQMNLVTEFLNIGIKLATQDVEIN